MKPAPLPLWCGLSLSNFASALSVRAPRAMSVAPELDHSFLLKSARRRPLTGPAHRLQILLAWTLALRFRKLLARNAQKSRHLVSYFVRLIPVEQ
jgi:hypothetical protein